MKRYKKTRLKKGFLIYFFCSTFFKKFHVVKGGAVAGLRRGGRGFVEGVIIHGGPEKWGLGN